MALQGNSWSCSCENVWLGRWLRRWMREALQLHTSVVERGQTIRWETGIRRFYLTNSFQLLTNCCSSRRIIHSHYLPHVIYWSLLQGGGEDHHLQQHWRQRAAAGGAGQGHALSLRAGGQLRPRGPRGEHRAPSDGDGHTGHTIRPDTAVRELGVRISWIDSNTPDLSSSRLCLIGTRSDLSHSTWKERLNSGMDFEHFQY